MRYGKIPGLDKQISRLVQGTMMIASDRREESFALLDSVFQMGCNTFDTAHVYNGGDSDRALGDWIRDRDLRDKVVILAKGAHHNQDRQRVTPFDIAGDLHDTLARMKVDYIDLYVLHRDDPSVPVGPIVEVFNELHAQGKIKAFGGSNWTHARVEEANLYAKTHNLIPFSMSSPNFSLAEQVEEPWQNCVSLSGPQGQEARNWYKNAGIPLFTWSSLAGGFFSGRFRRDNLHEFNSYFDALCVRCYCYEPNFQRLDRVEQLAKQYSVSIAQIALAYVLCQPQDIYALIGAANKNEFQQSAAALDICLTDKQLDWLDLRADSPE